MKVAGLVALGLLVAGCSNPVPLTATVETSATQNVAVSGRAQLVVKLTNTGPAIPHLGLVFMTADKWYEHHTVSDLGGCTVASDTSAFDCGDLAAGRRLRFPSSGPPKMSERFTTSCPSSWCDHSTTSTTTLTGPTSRRGRDDHRQLRLHWSPPV
jgi:hypothetical protein